MKTLYAFLILGTLTGFTFADCPTGWSETNIFEFYADSVMPCSSGMKETSDLIFVKQSESCSIGYVENKEFMEIICDSARGICGSAFTCIP